MTNGEKIKAMFPSMEVGFITESQIGIYFVKNQHSANVFDSVWWNAEYKEPTTKNDLGVDCISRDSAIKALDYDIKCFAFKPGVSKHMDDIAKLLNTIYETQVNNIKALPSVTSIRPKGHWIDHSDEGYVECPKCGSATNCDGNIADLHFCFSCGADMRGEE